jgi:putative DNA primase/helicase
MTNATDRLAGTQAVVNAIVADDTTRDNSDGSGLTRLRDALERVTGLPKRSGAGWVTRCPAHDDAKASLSFRDGKGQALLFCFAGCATSDVVEALGLEMRDLFDNRRDVVYRYVMPDGRLNRTVTRKPDKEFPQSIKIKVNVLYHLPEVAAAVAAGATVYLVAGEKDVETFALEGATATTGPGGEGNVGKVDLAPLRGAHVVAVVDRDAAGARWAVVVRERLAGMAATLEFVEAAVGKDATDHFVSGCGLGDFVQFEFPDSEAAGEAQPEDTTAETKPDETSEQTATVAEDDEPGDVLPGPGDPMRAARAIVKRIPHVDGVPTLAWWRGDFYRWRNGRWEPMDQSTVNGMLYRFTENATYMQPAKRGDGFDVFRWSPTSLKIGNLRNALAEGVLQRDRDLEPEDGAGTVTMANGVFDLATRRLMRPTPRRFNLVALPFAFDTGAQCLNWIQFLKEVTDADVPAHDLLQEWFGEILFGNTRHQKILYVKGPKRSGKGTINRVLHALMGPEATANPSLDGLGGDFGMQSLIGKSLAVISDAQWGGQNLKLACERLLTVSGEDPVTIARKYQTDWTGRLPTRFMLLSNDPPRPPSSSGALIGRLLLVDLKVSFFGREDLGLTNRLLDELPGIFNWALVGFDRLSKRGHFVEPESAASLKADVDRGGSVVRSFVQDECVIGGSVALDDLYARFRLWAEKDEGVHASKVPDRTTFSRELRSVVDNLDGKRARSGPSGKQVMTFSGISLR